MLGRLLPLIFLLLLSSVGARSGAQVNQQFPDDQKEPDRGKFRLPNGKLQQDEILKLEHNRSVQEAHQLVELSQALAKDIEQSGANVLSNLQYS